MKEKHGWLSLDEIAEIVGISKEEAKYHLDILKAGGLVKEHTCRGSHG
jgi:predicted ArsR family transcriptional regulator